MKTAKTASATAIAALLALSAMTDEPGNVLTDYEFENVSAWGANPSAVEAGRIESFRNLYAPLNHLRCRSSQTFSQTVSVATNADYVAGCVYLAPYDGHVTLSVPQAGMSEKMESAADWRDGRLYFNTGTNSTVSVALTAKSGAGVGRIFLRPRGELDPWPGDSGAATEGLLVPNGSFETGMWGFQISSREDVRYTLHGKRSVTVDTGTAAVGAASLKVMLPQMPTNALTPTALVQSIPFPVDPTARYVVRFHTKAVGGEAKIDLAGTPFYGVKPTTGWKEYRSCPVALKPKPHFGPSHFRLEFSISGNGATVWIDGIAVEKEGAPNAVAAPEAGVWFNRPFKLFAKDERAAVHAAAADIGAGAFTGIAEIAVTDIDGKEIAHAERKCAVAENGRFAFNWNVPTEQTGYRHVILSLRDVHGRVVASNATTYAVLPKPNDFPYAQSDAGEFARLFEWGPRNGRSAGWANLKNGASFDETLDALSLMGVKWIRTMGLQWFNEEVECGRSEYVFDDVLDRIRERGFGTLVEMMSHGIPKWSAARTVDHKVLRGREMPCTNAVHRYARAFARHYAGRVDAVNLINEMSGLRPDEYVEILRAVRAGFDDAKSQIMLQGPGWELPPPDAEESHWTRRAFALGLDRLTDGFGIHQYDFGHWTGDVGHLSTIPIEIRPFRNGRTWAEDCALAVRQYMERHPGKPVWDTETGNHFNTFAPWMKFPNEVRRDWYTERLAAARMIRYAVLKRSYGVTRWFHFMNMFFLQYHALDAMNIDGTPRSGIAALAVFRKELDGARYVSGGRIGDTRKYEITFRRPDGRRIAVAWDAEHETTIQPHRPPFPSRAFDLEGRPVTGTSIGGSPTYYIETDASDSHVLER